jgi:hypothetical protein
VRKDGGIGGPKALEHMVDTNLYFAKLHGAYRMLRCDTKNRFGETPRSSNFQMTKQGLVDLFGKEIPEQDEGSDEEAPKAKKLRKIEPKLPKPTKVVLKAELPTPSEIPASVKKSSKAEEPRLPPGVSIQMILDVPCENKGCHGVVDKACTSSNGARQAGFHQSRINRAKLLKPLRAKTKPPQKSPEV